MKVGTRLGIVAGGGDLPARLVDVCRQSGREVYVVAFEGETDPAAVDGVEHVWTRFGGLTATLDSLRDAGIGELVLVGPVRRPSLSELAGDLRAARFMAKIGLRALGDDGLLRAIIGGLEEEGFRVSGVEDFLGDLLAVEKTYGRFRADGQAEEDIARGLCVARALGRMDVGQAVVVQGGTVLGVEAQEGTDALLARCAGLRRFETAGVLVKAAKPGQDRRVDLPVIGARTVEGAAAAGLGGIAVEAGGVLVVDDAEVRAAADAAGIFVVGVPAPS